MAYHHPDVDRPSDYHKIKGQSGDRYINHVRLTACVMSVIIPSYIMSGEYRVFVNAVLNNNADAVADIKYNLVVRVALEGLPWQYSSRLPQRWRLTYSIGE